MAGLTRSPHLMHVRCWTDICKTRFPPPSMYRAGLPSALEGVIEKALSKSPAERYATMARFAEALAVAASAGGGTKTISGSETEGASVPNNLPRPRTLFIGREEELAECERLMSSTRHEVGYACFAGSPSPGA